MRHPSNHRAACRGGFLEIDVLAALVILAALTLALGAVLGRQHRAVQKLADTRAAMHLAEAVLTDLQAGRPLRKAGGDADVSVQLRSADDHAAGGAAADAWVEVVVNVRGGRASLTGLVPKDSIPPGGAP
jgi:Tfp pilus assembly protein PilX